MDKLAALLLAYSLSYYSPEHEGLRVETQSWG